MIWDTYTKENDMFFLLQKEDKYNNLDLETFIVKDILEHNKFMDEYIFYSKDDFVIDEPCEYPEYIKQAIPVGTIDFVEAWLYRFHKIDCINPIEIPPCLRKEEFLKREYRIVRKENLPTAGRIFFKDASRLKVFSGEINCETFFTDDLWKPKQNDFDTTLHLDPEHLFQVSEIVNIGSEYRIYIQDNIIQAIANYNGNPCLLPDVKLLQKMINIYSMRYDCPKAYTMDIAVNEKETFLLEIHPWIAVGLYNSLWSRNLLYAYRDGIQYVLDFNTKIEEWNN